jgi:glycosyltransferase involved in cell wall biosynthesis
MKVLSLSLDKKILELDSSVLKRHISYANKLHKLSVIVPGPKDSHSSPVDKLEIFGIGGNKIFSLLKIYFLSSNLIRRDRPDVITVQDQYFLALVACRLARKYKIGWELQVHGFEKMSWFRALVFKHVIKRANAIRTVSLRFKNVIVESYKIAEEKITVVPIQVPAVRGQVTDDIGKFVFLGVGRFVPVKRFDLMIKAFAEIQEKIPDAELWIAGEGPERGRLEAVIAGNNLGEKARLLGWQEDLSYAYNQASCFVLCSESEGWGMAIVEAMHYSLPIVMTDVGLAGEVVVNDESGLVVPVGDRKALGEAMLRVFQDNLLRERLIIGVKSALQKLPNEEETFELYKISWQKAINKY